MGKVLDKVFSDFLEKINLIKVVLNLFEVVWLLVEDFIVVFYNVYDVVIDDEIMWNVFVLGYNEMLEIYIVNMFFILCK